MKPYYIFHSIRFFLNRRKALKEYEKYCAPLLHLSGAKITLLQSSDEYGLVQLTKAISDDIDAVVVAGGDGTISEVESFNYSFSIRRSYHLEIIMSFFTGDHRYILSKNQ